MCPPSYHHNGFIATHALGHIAFVRFKHSVCRLSLMTTYIIYKKKIYIYIYIWYIQYVYVKRQQINDLRLIWECSNGIFKKIIHRINYLNLGQNIGLK